MQFMDHAGPGAEVHRGSGRPCHDGHDRTRPAGSRHDVQIPEHELVATAHTAWSADTIDLYCYIVIESDNFSYYYIV